MSILKAQMEFDNLKPGMTVKWTSLPIGENGFVKPPATRVGLIVEGNTTSPIGDLCHVLFSDGTSENVLANRLEVIDEEESR